MPRKPAILLVSLLLLLSIGGAVFHHHLRQHRPPSFEEVDAFLKTQAATGDWSFGRHISNPPHKYPRAGWWDYLHIRRYNHFQADQYFFGHASREHAAIAMIHRKNGVVQLLFVNIAQSTSGPVPSRALMESIAAKQERGAVRLKELEKSIFGKYPRFAPEVTRYSLTDPSPRDPASSNSRSSRQGPLSERSGGGNSPLSRDPSFI